MPSLHTHVAIGALASFMAAIMLYSFLGTARNQTRFWHFSTWLSAGLFMIAAGVFLLSSHYRYNPLWGEWAFDVSTYVKLTTEGFNYYLTVNIPPALNEADRAEVTAIRRRALQTLIVGAGVALLIVAGYMVVMNYYTPKVDETAAVVEDQGSQTRAHIDSAFVSLNQRLDTMAALRITDSTLLAKTTQRSLRNEASIKQVTGYVQQIAGWFRRWGRQTSDAIERTRQSIVTPNRIEKEPAGPIPTDRVKPTPTPERFRRRGKPVTYLQPSGDSIPAFISKRQ